MSTRARWRRWVKWIGCCGAIVIGSTWLVSARWLVWYSWKADVLEPDDARVVGLGEGGVFYRAFHRHYRSDYILGSAGWHTAPCAWQWGLAPPTIVSRQYRTDLWLPLWPVIAVVAACTVLVWLWPTHVRADQCCRCGYDLTGNTSGRCPECGTATGGASQAREQLPTAGNGG
jgi:hypothetical protein